MRKLTDAPATLLMRCWVICLLWSRAYSSAVGIAVDDGRAEDSWPLVWSDEFDNASIDTQKWTVLEGDGCNSELGCGWRRQQTDVSTVDNAFVDTDGHLTIVARNAGNGSSEGFFSDDGWITSARLSTFGSADFIHGKVEVCAKVARGGWGGWSGFWLLPSEKRGQGGSVCARINIVEITKDVDSAATASLDFGNEAEGCRSSDSWPHVGDACSLSATDDAPLSEDFHVYSLEWEGDEFRWYFDGLHYCTKISRFSSSQEDDPASAAFRQSFHLEMGLAVGGGRTMDARGLPELQYGARGLEPSASLPQEMLVDYVRISQGPSGSWWTPPAESAMAEADDEMMSSASFGYVVDTIAFGACVVGPYMAMTGLSRPSINTVLMGIEIGAFKAANATFLIYGNYVVAFAAAVACGLLSGYLALRHRSLARWNTVGGLSIPTLLLLIDVGMISGIGSRYVCWAIFFVLTISFAVLAIPAEYHSLASAVAAAATGSCVFKLGLGWLLGVPGEILKILDDPLEDRCHVSRVCQSLNWIWAATFFLGLWSQWLAGRKEFKSRSLDRSETPPSTPRRSGCLRSRAAKDESSSSGKSGSYVIRERHVDGEIVRFQQEQQQTLFPRRRTKEGLYSARGVDDSHIDESDGCLDEDDEFCNATTVVVPVAVEASGEAAWRRAFSRMDTFIRASVMSRRPPMEVEGVGCGSLGDAPTPVPLPPTGSRSNSVVSNRGDTIELVVHSPIKGTPPPASGRQLTSAWDKNDAVGADAGRDEDLAGAGRRHGCGKPGKADIDVMLYSSMNGNSKGPVKEQTRTRDECASLLRNEGSEVEPVAASPMAGENRIRAETGTSSSSPAVGDAPLSSADEEDVVSIRSVSDLHIGVEESKNMPKGQGIITGGGGSGGGMGGCIGDIQSPTSSRLAHAFPQKWGAWAGTSPSSSPAVDSASKALPDRDAGSRQEGECQRQRPGRLETDDGAQRPNHTDTMRACHKRDVMNDALSLDPSDSLRHELKGKVTLSPVASTTSVTNNVGASGFAGAVENVSVDPRSSLIISSSIGTEDGDWEQRDRVSL